MFATVNDDEFTFVMVMQCVPFTSELLLLQFCWAVHTELSVTLRTIATWPEPPPLEANTWIRRENAVSGLKGLQSGGPGEYRFCEAFYHR